MNIKTNLHTLGLDQRQAEIFLFLLSHKDIPAYEIAQGTDIPRTTVYKTLEELRKQGFVSSWLKNGVKYFSPESPKKLKDVIDEKNRILTETMPELLKMFSSDSIYPSAKLYIGKEGVKHVFEVLLEHVDRHKLKKLYVYSDDLLTEQFPKFFSEWRIRKNKTGAFTHLIVPHGTPMNDNYSSNALRETRFMPKEFSFLGSVDVTGNLVAFFSFKDKEVYSILIDSPIVAEMLTKLFTYIWDTLPAQK